MHDSVKQKFQYPISIYLIVSSYLILAIGLNYYLLSNFSLGMISLESLIAFAILLGIFIYPIQYKTKNMVISLGFQLPILILFGLFPIYLIELIGLFFPRGQAKTLPRIKQIFNYSIAIISDTLTYYLFYYLVRVFPDVNYKMVIIILISSFVLSLVQTGNIAIVVFLEKRSNFFKNQYIYILNLLSSNVMNGVISYYLYQSLGILGLFVAILYAILFSKRSRYQAAYDKKTAELIEVEHRAKMVFDTIDYGILVLDQDRRVKLANPVAQRALETVDPEPVGKKLDDFATSYSDELFNIIQWSYEQKKKFEQKSVRCKVRGEVRYFDIFTYPQFIDNEEMIGLIFLYKNVTEEHLIRRQLVEADKLTRLGQIAAGKVHEIKNPLTTVRGYLQFLKQKIAKGDQIKLNSFDIALQEIDRTNELINSLLILSKQSNYTPEIILLHSLVEEVVQLFQHQLIVKNISLELDVDQKVYIKGVENHLKQILINLFLNGIDALKENNKNPRITVRVYQKKDQVLLEFEDNGIGITEENLARLHQPFFTTKENGTGLGLSVTYKLIEEHGGTVQVTSNVGLGTTFLIQLPRIVSEVEEKEENLIYA